MKCVCLRGRGAAGVAGGRPLPVLFSIRENAQSSLRILFLPMMDPVPPFSLAAAPPLLQWQEGPLPGSPFPARNGT